MNKKQDLTAEQKHILHEEGTEAPGSSCLNKKKIWQRQEDETDVKTIF